MAKFSLENVYKSIKPLCFLLLEDRITCSLIIYVEIEKVNR